MKTRRSKDVKPAASIGILSRIVRSWRGCNHDWAYALGNSPGIFSGAPRPLCFRRACTICHRREEIEHFTRVVFIDGIEYMAGPHWRESTPTGDRK